MPNRDQSRSSMFGFVKLVLHRQIDSSEPRVSVEFMNWTLCKELRWVRKKPGDNAEVLFASKAAAIRAFKLWLISTIEEEVNEYGDPVAASEA